LSKNLKFSEKLLENLMNFKFLNHLALLTVLMHPLYGGEVTWSGGNNSNFLDTTNWIPAGVPGAADTAIFSNSGITFNPTISGSPAADLFLGEIRFADETSYVFNLAVTTSTQFRLQQGVANPSRANQFFSINGSTSILRFENSASADSSQSGKITYNAANGGRLRFANTSTASNAQIHLQPTGGLLEFFSNSTAANAQVTMAGSSATTTFFNSSHGGNAEITSTDQGNIVFTNTSNAENIHIMADKTTVGFSGSSQANNAQILATGASIITFSGNSNANSAAIQTNNSQVLFTNTAQGSNARLSMQNHSMLLFSQNNTLASITSDSTSQVDLQSFELTLGNSNANSLINGTISGIGGSLVKNGSGTLGLNALNLFTGETTINQGKLYGSGSVAGNLNILNESLFSPSNLSIATFNVGGNYSQSASSTLEVAVNGTGESSLVDVAGTAAINGSLKVYSPDGRYTTGTEYTIVHADGGRHGVFQSTLVNNPYFLPKVSYDAENAFLTLNTDFSSAAITQNQLNAAEQIDQIVQPNASEMLFINNLASLSLNGLRSSLQNLSGTQYVDLFQLSNLSNHRLVQRLRLLNLDAVCCSCGSLDFWIQGGTGKGHIEGDEHSKGVKERGWNIDAGFLKCLNSFFTVGAAFDFEYKHLNLKSNSHGKFTQTKGALFGVYNHPFFYCGLDLIGGINQTKIKRWTVSDTWRRPTSKPRIALCTAYFEFGKNLFAPFSHFQPFLGLDSTYSHLKKTKERHGGNSNLTISQKHAYLLDGLIGIHARGVLSNIDLRGDIAYRYHFTDIQNRLQMCFRNFGTSFYTQGANLPRSSFEGLVQLGGWFYECVQVYCQISGEKGDHFSTYQANFGIESLY